eukprot:TRINITY_DN6548_c0_g1_i1.p1 TRINITY_DN6548_c0_g1~~TRINITY_DN6548_c0_g1_i1.p1  ORF type:complete len:611 (-),score=106.45 TRINITY_DN6548_c0_g1_i1:601-2433(-)
MAPAMASPLHESAHRLVERVAILQQGLASLAEGAAGKASGEDSPINGKSLSDSKHAELSRLELLGLGLGILASLAPLAAQDCEKLGLNQTSLETLKAAVSHAADIWQTDRKVFMLDKTATRDRLQATLELLLGIVSCDVGRQCQTATPVVDLLKESNLAEPGTGEEATTVARAGESELDSHSSEPQPAGPATGSGAQHGASEQQAPSKAEAATVMAVDSQSEAGSAPPGDSVMAVTEASDAEKPEAGKRSTEQPLAEDTLSSTEQVQNDEGRSNSKEASAKVVGVPQQWQLAEFEETGVLGAGSFGIVTLGKHIPTGQICALKHVSKGLIVEKGMEAKIFNEKMVLEAAADCPFIIKLLGRVNEETTLVYVLEPCLGGDLQELYHRHPRYFGSTDHARFYVACASRGLAFLHTRKIIYRDMKPENVVLTSVGYAKLADMGLAKRVKDKTYTTCGSKEYWAPEVIAKNGYGLAVDWWALGVLLYELLAGRTPFDSGQDQVQIYRNIIKGINEVDFTKPALRDEAEDLIKWLCTRVPDSRPTVEYGALESFEAHPWFRTLDWSALDELRLNPPHTPTVADDLDTSNFREIEEADLPPECQYVDPGTGWDKDF